MNKTLFLLTVLIASGCGRLNSKSSSLDQLGATTHIWSCNGYKIIEAAQPTVVRYEVTIDRSGFDQQPGLPVTVGVRKRLDSNTTQPSPWRSFALSGRLLTHAKSFVVNFARGSLHASSPQYQGKFIFDGESVSVSCSHE